MIKDRIPKVNVVDENGKVVIEGAYYFCYPERTGYVCEKNQNTSLVEAAVTYQKGNRGMPCTAKCHIVMPPYRIVLADKT